MHSYGYFCLFERMFESQVLAFWWTTYLFLLGQAHSTFTKSIIEAI